MLSPPARAPVHVFDSRSRATVGYCTYSLNASSELTFLSSKLTFLSKKLYVHIEMYRPCLRASGRVTGRGATDLHPFDAYPFGAVDPWVTVATQG